MLNCPIFKQFFEKTLTQTFKSIKSSSLFGGQKEIIQKKQGVLS